jgi:hypothetical protein
MFRSTFIEGGRPAGYYDFNSLEEAKEDFEKSKRFKAVRYAAIYKLNNKGGILEVIEEYDRDKQ